MEQTFHSAVGASQASLAFGQSELHRGMMILPPPNVTVHLNTFNTLIEQPGQLLIVTGEPGAGKTSLLHHGMLHTAAAAMPRHHVRLQSPTAQAGVAGLAHALWPHKEGDGNVMWAQQVSAWCDAQARGCVVVEQANLLSDVQLSALWDVAMRAQQCGAPLVMVLLGAPRLAKRCAAVAARMVFAAQSSVIALHGMTLKQSAAWLKQQNSHGVLRKRMDHDRVAKMHAESQGLPRALLRLSLKADATKLGEQPAHIVEQAIRWLEEQRKVWVFFAALMILGVSGGWVFVAKPIAAHGMGRQLQRWVSDVRAHTTVHLNQPKKPFFKKFRHKHKPAEPKVVIS